MTVTIKTAVTLSDQRIFLGEEVQILNPIIIRSTGMELGLILGENKFAKSSCRGEKPYMCDEHNDVTT
jgi:hypothetical protein